MLARTRAETRALSHLMRERHLAGNADTERVVIEVSRNAEDGRIVEPLEIAVGDRLRIGATQWEKQLFNGTIVTVEDFKVLRDGAETNPDWTGLEPAAPSVRISARTDDGRKVVFRHDEIRDWHDNIRLDYGYALTITSAQGLTVDRAYLLADDRPARETIYPAATRHREEARYLRQPRTAGPRRRGEAAGGPGGTAGHGLRTSGRILPSAGRAPSPRRRRSITSPTARGGTSGRTPENDGASMAPETGYWEAANDNVFVPVCRGDTAQGTRLAPWRRRSMNFADGRAAVLAAYDDLRERTRGEATMAWLSERHFRETLSPATRCC